jgi:hypothetical protein
MKIALLAAAAALTFLSAPQVVRAAGGIYDEPSRDIAHTNRVYPAPDPFVRDGVRVYETEPLFHTHIYRQRPVYDEDPLLRERRIYEDRTIRVRPRSTTTERVTTRRVYED